MFVALVLRARTDSPHDDNDLDDHVPSDDDDGGDSRIKLRMPESLKARVEQSATREGLSVNSWLVRAAGAALERADPSRRHIGNVLRSSQQYTGWAR